MLDYCKMILEKVSFDPNLFAREFHKSLTWLKGNERTILFSWALTTFTVYGDTLRDIFERVK